MSVIGNNVKNYTIAAVSGSSKAINAFTSDGIRIASSIKLITAGTDVHIKFGAGNAAVTDFLLMQSQEVNFNVTETRIAAITDSSSSTVYVAITY